MQFIRGSVRVASGALFGVLSLSLAFSTGGCVNSSGRAASAESAASSCMTCHNGSQDEDYKGPGLQNPHPFPGADNLTCVTCHGGNPNGDGVMASHVPPPPEIGDDENLINDRKAYFNRLTLTGIDKFPDYEVNGTAYTAIDYLQFINPGDLRVVGEGRSCGQCHDPHVEMVSQSLLATAAGMFSGASFAAGAENTVPESVGLYQDTAADLGFRAVNDPSFQFDANDPDMIGNVSRLEEFPLFSKHGVEGGDNIFKNQDYNAAGLADDVNPDNSVITGSPLANLYHEQVAFTCGDCHLGSAGANNRYGDYRSSGCTACHMPYSQSGRSTSQDPNVNKFEPLDVDDIDEPERPHIRSHVIHSVARTLPNGHQVPGIDDYTCAGCHQGSNRTVMQYWGIRLDQNQDVRRNNQYPADPVSYTTTKDDERLFDPEINNKTFNGRNHNQYLLFEDYDGDGLDDTPPDIHYEAGMGCIDCHGSYDLHGGVAGADNPIKSRMEQSVAIRCESCHGATNDYAPTATGVNYSGETVELAVDSVGNHLRHVEKDESGDYFLTSRLTGKRHYVPQTMDTVIDSGQMNPDRNVPVYSELASFAMGRADGDDATGLGPLQAHGNNTGFSHGDSMTCAACHSSWTNNCIGCHLEGEYDTGNNFSNITGDRIVFEEDEAQFVYQSPVMFQLGVDTENKVAPISPNTETFFRYEDLNNDRSKVFAFSNRNSGGNNTLETQFPSLSHNVMMPHSIRGKVDVEGGNEGPRYCVACHLTDDAIDNYGTEYDAFRTALATSQFGDLDFTLLKTHIGSNPSNQLNSPFWVHMVAGLGTGLFLFDENGCAVNPLDDNDDRYGCEGVAPADNFDPARVALDLDRLVDSNGVSTGSNNHPMKVQAEDADLRDGSMDPKLSGPLGASLIERLADPINGIVLDAWINADGELEGDSDTALGKTPPE